MRDVDGEKDARQGWAEQPTPDERHILPSQAIRYKT